MQFNFTHKKIGIWGLGISGKSMVAYLKQYPCTLGILEKSRTPETSSFCDAHAAKLYSDEPEQRHQFLDEHDLIIASPGVDLWAYQQHAHKFLAEADLFHLLWKQEPLVSFDTPHLRLGTQDERKIIGITGTLGKTSITTLLTTLLTNAGVSLVTGGNIGTGMLDLLQSDATTALLELSSFQLEHCKHFVADGAVITNLFPNHLDRHGSMAEYLEAKKQILVRQQPHQWSLVPLELAPELRKEERLKNRPLAFFTQKVDENFKQFLLPEDKIYTPDFLRTTPPLSYPQNWLIIAAVLDLMGFDAEKIISQATNLSLPSYRLEEVATVNGVTYYNDSKSTIMQATLAAVDALKNNNIILLLGGTSKGVDRAPFIKELRGKVQEIICFGKEADELCAACTASGIVAYAAATLEEAVKRAHACAQPDNVVLLSPGGASFDLFKDYKERGERFKELVLKLK